MQDNYGWSPFLLSYNKHSTFSLLVVDARVDIKTSNAFGWSTLMYASFHGFSQNVKLLLSCGRNLDVNQKTIKDHDFYGKTFKKGSNALDIAKNSPCSNAETLQILEQYQRNPKEMQKIFRNQLNLNGKQLVKNN